MVSRVYRYWIDECCDPKPHFIDRCAPLIILASMPLFVCMLLLLGFDFSQIPARLMCMQVGFGAAGWILIMGMLETGDHSVRDAKRRKVYLWMMTPFLAMWLIPLMLQRLGW